MHRDQEKKQSIALGFAFDEAQLSLSITTAFIGAGMGSSVPNKKRA